MNYTARFINNLTTTLGVRGDYYPYNSSFTISPRFSAAYQLNELATIKASTGLYFQTLPQLLLSQNSANKNLHNPNAIHYIVGVDYLLTENTKLTVEAYQKNYDSFPIDPTQPKLFLIDKLFYRNGFFFGHGALTNNGKAESRGIELTIQKKLAENFYGLASASYFSTKYNDGENVWRNRVFENKIVVSIEGGYKPNNEWEFSGRWIFAGGVPYTPFNMQESQALQRAVLDEQNINGSRLPDYHSLNVRVDKRFYFEKTNLVAYISIWNAYNRLNVASYFWNSDLNKHDVIYQWGLLPIFGVEYEF